MTPEQKRAAERKKAALAAAGMVGGGLASGAKAVGAGAMAAVKGAGGLFGKAWGAVAGEEKLDDAPTKEQLGGEKSTQEIIDEVTAIMGKPKGKYQQFVTGLRKADFEKLTDLNEVTDAQFKAVGMSAGFMNKLKAHIRDEMIKFGANPDDNKEFEFVDKQCWILW